MSSPSLSFLSFVFPARMVQRLPLDRYVPHSSNRSLPFYLRHQTVRPYLASPTLRSRFFRTLDLTGRALPPFSPPNSRGSAPGGAGGYQDTNVPYSQYNNSNQGYHSPSPPTQQFQQMQPYQPPPQQQQVYDQHQPSPVVQAVPAKPPKKWDGMGKVLGE